MKHSAILYAVLAAMFLFPSAALAEGPFVGNSLVCTSGSRSAMVESYPNGTKALVFERRVSDTFFWRARLSTDGSRAYIFDDALPAHSFASDYRVHAKDAQNNTIATSDCELDTFTYDSVICTVQKNLNGSYRLDLGTAEGKNLTVTRQTTDGGSWHWRTKATSAVVHDAASPTDDARYRIVVHSNANPAQVERIVACQDLTDDECQYVQLTDGMPEGWQQASAVSFAPDGSTFVPVVPNGDTDATPQWAKWTPGGGPAELQPDGRRPWMLTPPLPDGSVVDVSYRPSWLHPLVMTVWNPNTGRAVWAPQDLRRDAFSVKQVSADQAESRVTYRVWKDTNGHWSSELWAYNYRSSIFWQLPTSSYGIATMAPIGDRAFVQASGYHYPNEVVSLEYLDVKTGRVERATSIQQSIESATGLLYRTSLAAHGTKLFVTVASAVPSGPAGVAAYDVSTGQTNLLYTVANQLLVSTSDAPLTVAGSERSLRYVFLTHTDYGGDWLYNRPVILDTHAGTVRQLTQLVPLHEIGDDVLFVGPYFYDPGIELSFESIVVDPSTGIFARTPSANVVGIGGTVVALSRFGPAHVRIFPGCRNN